MNRPLRALIVDDVEDDAMLMAAELQRGGFAVTYQRVDTADAMRAAFESEPWDVILCDFAMPRFSGAAALQFATERGSEVPFIYVSGTMGEETAVAAMKSGAHDYVMKDNLARLCPAVERELREALTRRESHRADLAMRESEHKYRHLFETLSDAAFLIDVASGRIIDTNAQAETLLGCTRAEIIGMNQTQLYPTGSMADDASFRAAINGERNYGFDLEAARKDGSSVPVHVSTSQIELYGRRLLLALFRNITELRKSQEQLRQLSRAIEQNPATIVITDTAGNIVYVNPKFTEVTGYSAAEVLGKNPRILKSDKTSPEEYQRLWQTITAGKEWHGEFQNKRKDGQMYWGLAFISPIADSAGNITHFLAVEEDITEYKLLEETIRRQDARFRALIENALDIITVLDTQHTIQYASPSIERALGYTPEELCGENIFNLVHPDDKPHLHQKFTHDLAVSGATTEDEARFRNKDSDWHIFEVTGKNLIANPDVKGIILNCRDITEKRTLESQFLRAQRLDGIGQLAGGIAHDLNNILSPILGSASLLRSEIKSPEGDTLLTLLETNTRRAADVVKQLLTFAKGIKGERVLLQPRHLITEIAKLVRETFPKSITLLTHAPNNLWMLSGDFTQLQQVLLNLALNARDAMPSGGTLTLTASNIPLDHDAVRLKPGLKPGHHIVLQVADTGTGIAPEIADRVFDPFFSTKGPDKGTGLGLSTVMGIVKSHGGFIQFTDNEGRGTKFDIYLPATISRAVEPGNKPLQPLPQGRGELILIVDDEEPVRIITQRILESNGYRTLGAANGAEAIATYLKHTPQIDLVLTDNNMPVMGGRQMTAKLRQLNPHIKIIATTGADLELDAPARNEMGVLATITKPCDNAKLLATLHDVLETTRPL